MSKKYKKALVTGGAGFIGSHIVGRLLEKNIETTVYDNFSTGKLENIPKGVKIIRGDILDSKSLNKTFKDVDVVFHNAAKVSIRDSVKNFSQDAQENIIGT